MRIVSTLLALALSAGAAQAQAQDWSGPYGGVTAGMVQPADGEFKTVIEPVRDPRLTYTVPPQGRSQIGPDFDNSAFGSAYVGWRVELGSAVVGVEAQVQSGGVEARYASGPLPSMGPGFNVCGAPALGCLLRYTDVVTAEANVDGVVSLKASAGLPLTDRLLVSAYVGPSIAFGNVSLAQRSQLDIGGPRPPGSGCMIGCSIPVTNDSPTLTSNRSQDDRVWGVVAGLTADYKLTETLLARADLGYARYQALSLEGDAFETRVWAQPVAVTASIGVSFRF